jgi:photosystem II stability/assembly factor-like uncharacterized protein
MKTLVKMVFIAAWAILFAFAPCLSVDWELVGLANRSVYTLHQYNEYLYVGTDDGVYKTNLDDALSSWEFLGLSGNSIRALIVTGPDTVLAGLTSGTVAIYRTVDNGQSWAPYENGWGGGSFEPVFAFEPVSIIRSTGILATGMAVIGKSPNSGQSWQVLWGDWGGFASGLVFIRVDPNALNIIWAGGEATALNPVLLKSIDHGMSWEYKEIYGGGDNRCHDIAIYPGNSNMAWVSMEGRIRKTADGGESWSDVMVNNYYLYGIEIDSLRPNYLYASGYRYDQPLTLFKSEDNGNSWLAIYENSYPVNGAYDILMLSLSDRNVIYFSTDYGVYRYNDILPFVCGDANGDEQVNVGDAVFLIAYVFSGGPPPDPVCEGDANGDGGVNVGDAVYLIAYVFSGGPPPVEGCCP